MTDVPVTFYVHVSRCRAVVATAPKAFGSRLETSALSCFRRAVGLRGTASRRSRRVSRPCRTVVCALAQLVPSPPAGRRLSRSEITARGFACLRARRRNVCAPVGFPASDTAAVRVFFVRRPTNSAGNQRRDGTVTKRKLDEADTTRRFFFSFVT